jgi:hypothetical protein
MGARQGTGWWTGTDTCGARGAIVGVGKSKARLWILGVPGSSLKESGIENVTDGKSVFSLSGGNVDIGILRRPFELDGMGTCGTNGMMDGPEMLSQAWRV